eukprot:SAG11_NODE_660_length_7893_cov_4.055042_9_plen_241_part_00
MVTMAAGEELVRASDGLALARCGGLSMRLSKPGLAALGAGSTHTAATTKGIFVAAEEALRGAQSQGRACGGGQARATRSCRGRRGAAPRTRHSGGAVAGWGEDRRRPRPTWRHSRLTTWGRSELESALSVVFVAVHGGRAAEARMAERARDYSLVYDVVALAPSFGRTRGVLRAAAGYSLVWPASRTRASLAEARVAAAKARRAWRASETSLELLRVDYERLRDFTKDMEELREELVARA